MIKQNSARRAIDVTARNRLEHGFYHAIENVPPTAFHEHLHPIVARCGNLDGECHPRQGCDCAPARGPSPPGCPRQASMVDLVELRMPRVRQGELVGHSRRGLDTWATSSDLYARLYCKSYHCPFLVSVLEPVHNA